MLSKSEAVALFGALFLEDVPMRTKNAGNNAQPGQGRASINAAAQNPSREVWAAAPRRCSLLSTTSGPLVVAAVFCLVFLVMGTAFSFSTFASDLGRDLKAGSGAISFIFSCAMALLMPVVSSRALWPIASARTG